MPNRNRKNRNYLDRMISVYQQDTGELYGYLHDIHIEGASILSESSFNNDEKFAFLLEYKDEKKNIDGIRFEATCIWSKDNSYMGLNRAGFKFDDISLDSKKGINHLIRFFGLSSH
ncbi:MAG: PilZ domain-containing protein [Deltaproteobacteria bacterium]|nr:PilZ domain-containing protein [Deltaproteobacteria bacterium]